MTKINQHTTALSKALLTAGLLGGAAVASLGASSAQAAIITSTCPFTGTGSACTGPSGVGWTTIGGIAPNPLQLGDKLLNILDYDFNSFDNAGNAIKAPGEFQFTMLNDTVWSLRAAFIPAIEGFPGPPLPKIATGTLHYTLAITDPNNQFLSVEIDSAHLGTGSMVTKTILGGPVLNSVDGSSNTTALGGTFVDVTDVYTVQPGAGLNSFSNGFTQVPAPLPILGAGAAFGSIRKLRKFSSRLKTFSMG
jgi:hypothetical protein